MALDLPRERALAPGGAPAAGGCPPSGWALRSGSVPCSSACLVGPAGLGVRGVLLELLDAVPLVEVDSGLSVTQQAIFWEIRLPRVVLGVLVGATLAAAGTAYQGVFRNPLADPYLLGVSSGAGLGATLGIVAGGGESARSASRCSRSSAGCWASPRRTPSAAPSGGGRGAVVIVLAGVAVGAFFNAIQNFVQQQYDDSLLSVYSWMLGRLSTDGWTDVLIALPYVVRVVRRHPGHRRMLDVMAVGDVEAASLGVDPVRVRLRAGAGRDPGHRGGRQRERADRLRRDRGPARGAAAVRRRYHTLLPLSLLLRRGVPGARRRRRPAALAPAEVPIGVVTAVVGAPFFLVVLRRHKGGL